VIHFSDVTKSFGGQVLYRNASFQANPGEKIGLVGPNGAGKTTVFRILTGAEGVESGTVSMPSRTNDDWTGFLHVRGEVKLGIRAPRRVQVDDLGGNSAPVGRVGDGKQPHRHQGDLGAIVVVVRPDDVGHVNQQRGRHPRSIRSARGCSLSAGESEVA